MPRLTTKEAAEYLGVCKQRIDAKLAQGHFPNHGWCECGRSILIPEGDLKLSPASLKAARLGTQVRKKPSKPKGKRDRGL